MRLLAGDECGLLKEFVPEIAQRQVAKEEKKNPKKSDIILPVHYDRMQNINNQHGMKRVAPNESQTRVRAVVDMAMLKEEGHKFQFASLRANGSVEVWQSQHAKMNHHASYHRLSLSGDIFETAKDKSPIATVPVKPLALEAASEDRLVACDTHGNLVLLKTSENNIKPMQTFSAFANNPDNVTLTYTKGKVLNKQLASAMALCPQGGVAIGGRERDIRFLDLETGKCQWKAKNLPPDPQTLMQQPIWPSALTFLKASNLLAVGSGFGQVRLYDVRSNVRRPLHYTPEKAKGLEHRITAIAGVDDHQIVAGDTTGDLHALDLRHHFHGQRYNQHDTSSVTLGRYVGPAGSIRQLKKHPTLPILAAVGCDRMLRTYDTHKQKVVDCVYLKQRLNCVLLCQEGRRVEEEEEEFLLQANGEVDMEQEDVVEDYVDSDQEESDSSGEEEEGNGKAAVNQRTAEDSESEDVEADGKAANDSSESESGSDSEEEESPDEIQLKGEPSRKRTRR